MTTHPNGSLSGPDERADAPEPSVSGDRVRLDPQSPWPGLPAYDEASSAFFRGRKDEAAELLRLIRVAPLATVYGKSGLGKTSLLQAGLFPLLRAEHYLPVYVRVDFSEGIPLAQVMRRLEEELAAEHAEHTAPEPGEGLWEFLHRRDLEIWSPRNFPLTPVLVFDQFEELFSRSGGNVDVIREVFDGLANLIENRIPGELASDAAAARRARLDLPSRRYRIVLSFREDFLPDVRMWEKQVPSLLRHSLRLEPMSRRCAIEAVEEAGVAVLDAGVAPAIVDFVARRDRTADAAPSDTVVEPVLLSLCCYQLNRRRAPGSKIDKTLVDEAGQDILDSFYREALDDPEVKGPPDAAQFIEDYLIQGDHFRGDYPKEEALDEHKLNRTQLAALTDRHRLLRIVHHADTARVELIHDRLVPLVRKARDERRTKARQDEQERLAREAQAERDRERARSAELEGQRDVARRSLKIAASRRNMALMAAGAAIVSLIWVAISWSQLQERTETAQIIAVAQDTLHLAAGRLALTVGSEPLEQTMYRGLAAYRLSGQRFPQAKAAGLLALHSAMEASGYLLKAVTITGLVPTPAVAYGPDRKLLAVGAEDGVIRLLDASTYSESGRLDCGSPGEAVWTLSFNSDGTRLAAGYTANVENTFGAGLVCVFDVPQRSILRKWSAKEVSGKAADVYSVAYGGKPGAEVVVWGGSDKVLRLLDVQTGAVREHAQNNTVVAVAVSPDGRATAWGSDDGIIRILEVADIGKPTAHPVEFPGHEDTVQQVVFAPGSSSILVSGGDDGRVMVWHWNGRGGCLAQQSQLQTARLYNLAVNADGVVAAAGADGNVRLFQLKEASCAPSTRASAPTARAVEVPEFDVIQDGVLSGHGGYVMATAFNPDGNRFVSTGADGSIRIWGPKTGGFSLAELMLSPGSRSVTSLAISPDMRFIAAGDSTGSIHLWDRPQENTDALMQPAAANWVAHRDAIHSLAYVRIGDRFALVSAGDDGVIKRWDAATRSVIAPDMADSAESVRSIAVSPDGKTLAAGSRDGTVRLWDVATGARIQTIEKPANELGDYQLYAVGFSHDGTHLAVGSSYGVSAFDLDEPDVVRALQGHMNVVTHVSHSGTSWLLSAGLDGRVLEWPQTALTRSPNTGLRKRDEFTSRMGVGDEAKGLMSMSANADGLILTGGKEGQVQIWDGVAHVMIGPRFLAHGNSDIQAVALAADGSFFVTTDATTILLWPGPDRWAEIICSKLTWNMSLRQWRDWVSPDIAYKDQCSELRTAPDDARK